MGCCSQLKKCRHARDGRLCCWSISALWPHGWSDEKMNRISQLNQQYITYSIQPLFLNAQSTSSSWNTKALTSMLSRAGASFLAPVSSNAVCGTRLARPSFLLSKHLMRRTCSGDKPDLYTHLWLALCLTAYVSPLLSG